MFTETQAKQIDEKIVEAYEKGMIHALELALELQDKNDNGELLKLVIKLKSGGVEAMMNHIDNMMTLHSDNTEKKSAYWWAKNRLKRSMGFLFW